MKTPIVEALFGTGPRAKIMQWLYLRSDDSPAVAARALAREAGIPYGSVDKALRELVASQLVVRDETPYGPHYRAPREDPRLAGLFTLLRQDSVLVNRLKKALKSFKQVSYACVFGSFASGNTHRASDIDVLVLESAGLDRFAVMTELSKVSIELGREVSPEFYGLHEFLDKLERGDAVALSIATNPRMDLKGEAPWPN
jgi:predicted nucleotidyltransferase